jgi:arylformamidase
MEIIDITMELADDMTSWPGVEPFTRRQDYALAKGDIVNESQISCDCHTGTHLDAPRHLSENGFGISEFPLDQLIGPALVCAISPECQLITPQDLAKTPIWPGCILLLKTRNSGFLKSGEFHKDYTAISPEAAQFLVDRQIKVVGIDYLSVEPYGSSELKTHITFLSNNIGIIEGINLEHVQTGAYFCIVLPLKIKGGDGAPARVILLR